MKISLITINRNNREGLKRTLASVAEQIGNLPERVEVEYIVVDGESTDGSLEAVKGYADALHPVVVSSPPKGVYNAINVGLEKTYGDVIGLLHSGDTFATPSTLAEIAEHFRQNPTVDYIYGDIQNGARRYSGEGFSIKRLKHGYAPPHPSLYVRRHVLNQVGNYDETFSVAADFDYFVRLAAQNALKGLYIPRPIVVMEGGGLSQRLSNRLWRNNRERYRALKKNGIAASYPALYLHYFFILKEFLCSSKNRRQ